MNHETIVNTMWTKHQQANKSEKQSFKCSVDIVNVNEHIFCSLDSGFWIQCLD